MELPGISVVLFSTLIILMLLNCPISVCLGLSTVLTLVYANNFLNYGMALVLVPQKMFTSVDSFPLMAIPFFMIAGSLMEHGGISKRLVSVAQSIIGSISGGLAMVTVMASMFFAAISGSSPATVAAIGSLMIPAMVKQGYDLSFAAACQSSSGYIGVIIPPSIPMITYGVVTGASIGTLFMAGFMPGLYIGLALMIVAFVTAKKRKYKGGEKTSFKIFWAAFREGVWAILMPIIILGGIYGGFFTPTEAANVAVVYGFIVSAFVYKELKLKTIPTILRTAAISSAMVMLLIATATAFGVMMTREKIPAAMASFFVSLTANPVYFLLLVNVLLLILGTFLETNAAIIIVTPILYPVAMQMGVDPIHFGIIIVINLAIGMITPPLGVNLFVACGLTKLKVEKIVAANWWFLFASLAVLLLLTYFPSLSLMLPRILMN
ncbi:MAG: TRAP transporter large permease [Deltaproteobacteria bacterium]|jgi:C4-dicarboxylate transporter DctM subunit|nr:TRAP transporter large permease [Deltaproteobacteria bacterium]